MTVHLPPGMAFTLPSESVFTFAGIPNIIWGRCESVELGEMLTRIFLDNFRCFVNFEHRPARKELIMGRNGSGKSSLVDALRTLRNFVAMGDMLDEYFVLTERTRWLNQREITFELEAELDGGKYIYRLVIEPWGAQLARPRVASETVRFDGKSIFDFTNGEVQLFNDQFEHKVTYPFDPNRSALATIVRRNDNSMLSRFKDWLCDLFCFRLNPFAMAARAEGEDLYPNVNLSNVGAWYRHLTQAEPLKNAAFVSSLGASLDGFKSLQLEPAGENVRVLTAAFASAGRKTSRFFFGELSDGQRCLISLYAVLHFVLANGSTVLFDEPDNFLSLREIQPWLSAVDDTIEDYRGQMVLISHNPEIINQWAPSSGVQLLRDDAGAVRVERFKGDPTSCLAPSELVARGWERDFDDLPDLEFGPSARRLAT